ncbi:MAG: hypothetical protein J6333_13130, partial [Planctomycetes bacterium]|nr:hypothetical protein [Planctomycetota bacterium]
MNAAPFAPAARWCWHALTPSGTSGFFLFRREFRLDAPARLVLRVSADNRYNFYVDGQLLGRGPARGDLAHYRYETYEVALGPGAHALAAEVLVWSLPFNREAGPWSEIHTGGGFLCEVAGAPEELSTPAGWLGAIDPSRRHAEWDGAVVPAPP